jgi:hypothetical protein
MRQFRRGDSLVIRYSAFRPKGAQVWARLVAIILAVIALGASVVYATFNISALYVSSSAFSYEPANWNIAWIAGAAGVLVLWLQYWLARVQVVLERDRIAVRDWLLGRPRRLGLAGPPALSVFQTLVSNSATHELHYDVRPLIPGANWYTTPGPRQPVFARSLRVQSKEEQLDIRLPDYSPRQVRKVALAVAAYYGVDLPVAAQIDLRERGLSRLVDFCVESRVVRLAALVLVAALGVAVADLVWEVRDRVRARIEASLAPAIRLVAPSGTSGRDLDACAAIVAKRVVALDFAGAAVAVENGRITLRVKKGDASRLQTDLPAIIAAHGPRATIMR